MNRETVKLAVLATAAVLLVAVDAWIQCSVVWSEVKQ